MYKWWLYHFFQDQHDYCLHNKNKGFSLFKHGSRGAAHAAKTLRWCVT